MMNHHYPTHEQYLFEVVREIGNEYCFIVDQGFLLRIDAPGIAMERAGFFQALGSDLRERIVQHLEAIDFPPGASSGSEEADLETADSSAAVHPAREARHAGGRCGASGTRRWFRPVTSCPCRIRTGSSLVRSARPASQPRVEIHLALAL